MMNFFSAAIQIINIKFMPLIGRELFQVYITLYVGQISEINRIIGQENFFYRPAICFNRCFHNLLEFLSHAHSLTLSFFDAHSVCM